jgi:hypothetical protein
VALLVLGCRGSLAKMAPALANPQFRALLLCLRLAVLFHHGRRPIDAPRIAIAFRPRIRCDVPARWCNAHPLTAHLLAKERGEWATLGYRWQKAA